MYNFNKKQKVILGILMVIVAGFICYYVYAREEESNTQLDLENNIEIQEEMKEKNNEGYSDDRILVHVSGAVNKEGVVELKPNSRISDAIDKANGIREDAYIDEINLAYKLEDGMKIHIPTKQEKENADKINEIKVEQGEEYVMSSSGVSMNQESEEKTSNVQNTKVNINTATQAQLETLPGIGTSTATKIIAYRKEKGKFTRIEDIKDVSGIGETKFEKIKDFISIK